MNIWIMYFLNMYNCFQKKLKELMLAILFFKNKMLNHFNFHQLAT